MNRAEALHTFESSMEGPLKPGTLDGDEVCEDLSGWNSLAILSFISAVNKQSGITLPPGRVLACRRVDDLLDLVVAMTTS